MHILALALVAVTQFQCLLPPTYIHSWLIHQHLLPTPAVIQLQRLLPSIHILIAHPPVHQHLLVLFVFIGLGLPPIAKKLFERIEAGSFIEMAELLPENLNLFTTTDADQSIYKIKRRVVTNIVEWLQCFSTYVAIVSYKQPERVSDLLGYQNLIIQASQDYEGDFWLDYDCRFRQQLAAFPSTNWARTDSSLWNQFFFG